MQAVHWPLEAPQTAIDRFSHIPNRGRQLVAAMASVIDEGVGNVTAAVARAGETNSTLVVFSSDK